MSENYEKKPFLITEDQVNAVAWVINDGIPLCEDESATAVWAYGHIDPEVFANEVNLMDKDLLGEHFNPEETYSASDVDKVYGAAYYVVGASEIVEDEFYVQWQNEPSELAVPITRVWR